MSKRILFINLYFEMGGVETLLLRLIRELKPKGFHATVLLLRRAYDPALMAELRRHAEVRFLADVWSPIPSRMRQGLGGEAFDYIFATINDALLLGALLNQFVYPGAHLMAGVYQTELFCPPVTPRYRHRQAIRDLFRDGLPDRNKIFGNDAAKAHHEKMLGRTFSEAPVIPLMIDVDKFLPVTRERVDRRKIVSIGRICDFKTYNFSMLDVVTNLRAKGHDVEYHIHGDGPDMEKLQGEIRARGLATVVFTHGPLDYSRFKEAVSDAIVFVGSGTAVMEAAACGVPSIPAIEYARTADSYGFIHEIAGTSFFEPDLPYQRKSIEALIERLLVLTAQQLKDIEARSTQRVRVFSPEHVVDATVGAFKHSVATAPNGLRYASSFLRGLVASKLAKREQP